MELSASEFRLLRFLARNRDRVFTPAQLVEEVWGPEYAGDRHLARVYVRRVRRKIERRSGAVRATWLRSLGWVTCCADMAERRTSIRFGSRTWPSLTDAGRAGDS